MRKEVSGGACGHKEKMQFDEWHEQSSLEMSMEVIIKFLMCFIKEFQPAIPVLITHLGICAFLYAKSDAIQKESFDFKVIFLLLSLLLAAVPVSATGLWGILYMAGISLFVFLILGYGRN